MNQFTSTTDQKAQLLIDWAKFRQSFSNEAPPRETARSWGFEIETPEADQLFYAISDYDKRELLSWQQDSSIEGYGETDDCDCDCRYCAYHDCDCENCEYQNTDPEHGCGSDECYQEGTEYQEIATHGGGVKTTHPEALTVLTAAGLESVKITENCGLHLNIGSQDLTPAQVARVLTAYRIGEWLFTGIAGRVSPRYAKTITPDTEEMTRKGIATEKMTAVNTNHHFYNLQYNRPELARLEFRQHQGENNPAQIRAWAWLLIELVEFAKSGRPLYWLTKATTLAEFRDAIRR